MSGANPTHESALHGRVKLAYDDFVLFPDDGKGHELIDGEHYVTPSPNLKHQKVSGNLHLLIGSWLADHPVGQISYAPLDVVVSKRDVVEPDLLYVSKARADVLTTAHLQGRPTWSSRLDRPARGSTTKRSSGGCTNAPASRNTG